MSRLNVDALHSEDGGSSNIELDDSRNTTCKGNLTVDGNISVTGTGLTDTKSFRNIIINGAMQVAQRGTSSTTSGYATVDRFNNQWSGTDENCTQAQVDVTSSDTGPWEKGFRKSLRITNGNQTSGAGAADYMRIYQAIEAQNLAGSGWDYTSASSYITLSFWVKSSVAQTFYGYLLSIDGTSQRYAFSTGALSADTWTKVTKTIPGNSNITIDNNNGIGMYLFIHPFAGTDTTASGVSLTGWETHNASARMPDNTSTWWTTNDATFEITGVQLEVGDAATEFEHRSYHDEELRCMRYYERRATGAIMMYTVYAANSVGYITWDWKVRKRAGPNVLHSVWDAAAFGTTGLTIAAGKDQARFSWTNGNHGYVGDNTILEADAEL